MWPHFLLYPPKDGGASIWIRYPFRETGHGRIGKTSANPRNDGIQWKVPRFWSENMLPFLRSCPHLQSFVNNDAISTLDVKTFIDRDPVTNTLRPWDCERTLKVLRFAMTATPRKDWPGHFFEGEASFSQGYEIHNGLFDRLARLTHLEALWLESRYKEDDNEFLELSLESGLYTLYGLQQLRELHFGWPTKIGIQDVQWMVESWPRLRVIDGLDVDGVHEEAVGWIRKTHPEISVL